VNNWVPPATNSFSFSASNVYVTGDTSPLTEKEKTILTEVRALILWADDVFAEVAAFWCDKEKIYKFKLQLSPCTADFWRTVWKPRNFPLTDPEWQYLEDSVILRLKVGSRFAWAFDFLTFLNSLDIKIQYEARTLESADLVARAERRTERAAMTREWRRRQRAEFRRPS
jgi:hypothetical protein